MTAPDADADADVEIDADVDAEIAATDDAEIVGDGDIEDDEDADTNGELGHPFGTHGGYHPIGVIFPSTRSPEQLDEATLRFYEEWRERYLEEACEPGQYRVKTRPATEAYTVSEGHGYGMLFAVLMAGAEPAAQEIFNGLFAYSRDHPSGGNHDLMAWAQNRDCENIRGAASATDGDLDIALSLLLAHRQWGSEGDVDYLHEASIVIGAILESDIHPSGSVLVGDWARNPEELHHRGTRPSDFMPEHFRIFAEVTGERRWYEVIEKTYEVVATLQDDSASETGLLPDFAVEAPTDNPVPAPRGWLEGANDGRYG